MFGTDIDVDCPADDTSIWRYMDFPRFVAMLDTRSVWFSRADRFEDTFETVFPRKDIGSARSWMLDRLTDGTIPRASALQHVARLTAQSVDTVDRLDEPKLSTALLRYADRFIFISSWHRNDDESAGMWDVYPKGPHGVAVRSTVGALRTELQRNGGEHPPIVGAVHYLDYEHESWGDYHPLSTAFHKRRSFAHEQEIRAVLTWPAPEAVRSGEVDLLTTEERTGFDIPVDLERVITEVVVSPRAEAWMVDLVGSLMKRFDLPGVPVRSTLYDDPWEDPD